MKLQLGLNHCTNEEYHADREFISSSVLKTIYTNIEDYYKQYILGQKKEFGNKAALEFGTLVHSMILEPHLVPEQYAFFSGWKRAGAEYEAFAAENAGKMIITKQVKHQADELVKRLMQNPRGPEFFVGGAAEQTICFELDGVKIKTRFDYINPDKGFISDVKTTGYSSDIDSFKLTLDGLKYQLSAALYCMAAESYYGKPFDFYFVVLSKKDSTADIYKTSAATMIEGKKMIKKAVDKLKKARETNTWKEADTYTGPDIVEAYEILEV